MSAPRTPVAAGTGISFRDGRNPAIELTLSVADSVLFLRAIDALAGETAGEPVVGAARALRSSLVEELVAVRRLGLDPGRGLTAADFDLITSELTALAEDDPDDLWVLTTRRLPILSGPRSPSALAVIATALSGYAKQDARAAVLLLGIEAAVDAEAVREAAARLAGPHRSSEAERRLAAAGGELNLAGAYGELFWDEDTRTAFWACQQPGPPEEHRYPGRAVELRLASVEGVEFVVVRQAVAPTPDADLDLDPSWRRVPPTIGLRPALTRLATPGGGDSEGPLSDIR